MNLRKELRCRRLVSPDGADAKAALREQAEGNLLPVSHARQKTREEREKPRIVNTRKVPSTLQQRRTMRHHSAPITVEISRV
ncbi:uncharacterized protein EI90DRAFT_3092634, partial [Cantharellus anzutake]|uniref:uncharacterized protein n=1 Tax=Cantharellus anzutake TaxID=1750568 RepID=UPI001906E0BE